MGFVKTQFEWRFPIICHQRDFTQYCEGLSGSEGERPFQIATVERPRPSSAHTVDYDPFIKNLLDSRNQFIQC